MQKMLQRSAIIYLGFLTLTSCAFAMLLFHSYKFVAHSGLVWFVFNLIIFGSLTALCIINRKTSTKAANVISQLLPLFSLIHICLTLLLVEGIHVVLLLWYALLCFFCCYAVSLLHKNPQMFKITCVVLNSIMLCVFLSLSSIVMVLAQFSQNNAEKTQIYSNKPYTVINVNADLGPFGKSSFIDTKFNDQSFNAVIGQIIKSKRSYIGVLGESETVSLAGNLQIDRKIYCTIKNIFL